MVLKQYRRSVALLLLVAFFVPAVQAEKLASIIIDDLGNNLEFGNMVINLPAPITLAFLPHTEYANELAESAHQSGKEVMLHLPLQSVRHHSHTPGTLKLHMTHKQFISQLKNNIHSIPHIKGINNHMGSLLTRHPGHMDWLMAALANEGNLYFVDSKTTHKSVAPLFATKHQVPFLNRDIFLDPDFRPETIRREFTRFINKAKLTGYAIAIAHPYPGTIQFIQQHLDELEEQGIRLVPVSEIIAHRQLNEEIKNVASTGATGTGL
jgi:polysaccharide deacetylase 2 family uncharacterized protein YibQ